MMDGPLTHRCHPLSDARKPSLYSPCIQNHVLQRQAVGPHTIRVSGHNSMLDAEYSHTQLNNTADAVMLQPIDSVGELDP